MLAVRLPESIEKRLEKVVKRTGRTKTFYAREAILRYIEDLEDVHAAERILRRVRAGKELTYPIHEAVERLRLLLACDEKPRRSRRGPSPAGSDCRAPELLKPFRARPPRRKFRLNRRKAS